METFIKFFCLLLMADNSITFPQRTHSDIADDGCLLKVGETCQIGTLQDGQGRSCLSFSGNTVCTLSDIFPQDSAQCQKPGPVCTLTTALSYAGVVPKSQDDTGCILKVGETCQVPIDDTRRCKRYGRIKSCSFAKALDDAGFILKVQDDGKCMVKMGETCILQTFQHPMDMILRDDTKCKKFGLICTLAKAMDTMLKGPKDITLKDDAKCAKMASVCVLEKALDTIFKMDMMER